MTITITILLIIALVTYDVVRKKRLPIDAFRVALIVYGLGYILIPELLPLSYAAGPYINGVPWLPRIISIAGLFTLILGYYLSYTIPIFKTVPKIQISEKNEYRFTLFVLLLSILALYIYASSFGGLLKAFSYGSLHRFSGGKLLEVQAGGVAVYFVGIAYLVIAISQYNLYNANKYRKKYILLLVSAAIILLALALIMGGRGAIFNALVLSLFIHFNMRGFRITFKKAIAFIMIFLIGLSFVVYGKKAIGATASVFRGENISTAFTSIESKKMEYVYGRLISECSNMIKSIGVVTEENIEYNYMKHYAVAPLHLIPTKLFGISSGKPYRITELNTFMLTGDTKGGKPPGIVASLWYGGGLVGVLLGCMFFGCFIGWIQRQCYDIAKTYPCTLPIILYIFFRSGRFISNGDPSVFLKHMFHLIVFLMLVVVYYWTRRIHLYPHQASLKQEKELLNEN